VNVNGSGQATVNFTFNNARAHVVKATYNGNTNFAASPQAAFNPDRQPGRRPARHYLVAESDGVRHRGDAHRHGHREPTGAGPANGGTVTFVIDKRQPGPVPVSGGTATLTLSSTLAAGTHTITATLQRRQRQPRRQHFAAVHADREQGRQQHGYHFQA